MKLIESALNRSNDKRPPVWFMRQAGRYHSHYQALRKQYSFIELCKKPEIACEVTMGPIRDFDFDAAIMFSDLLFPLEAMGMGLRYDEGPKLNWHLRSPSDLNRLKVGSELIKELEFQGQALELIRKTLPQEKGLLGFVGAPWTLYCYAVEGSHQGTLDSAHAGLRDGRFTGFTEKLHSLLLENMLLQARSGADAVALFDTCGGEVDATTYRELIVPSLRILLEEFKKSAPTIPIVYYSKGTGPQHWEALVGLPISCMGIDWRHDIAQVLSQWSDHWAIQGNIDPQWLFLDPIELESRLRAVFASVKQLDSRFRRGWVCGLGHGILPKTPESNVRLFLRIQKEIFG